MGPKYRCASEEEVSSVPDNILPVHQPGGRAQSPTSHAVAAAITTIAIVFANFIFHTNVMPFSRGAATWQGRVRLLRLTPYGYDEWEKERNHKDRDQDDNRDERHYVHDQSPGLIADAWFLPNKSRNYPDDT